MGLVVADLIAKLGLDAGAFDKGMDQSKKKAMTWGDGLKKAQVGAAVGLAAIVGVAAKGVQSYEQLTASVAALQRQSKVSATDASLLVGQWQRYGVSTEAGGKATVILSKNIDAVRQASAKTEAEIAGLDTSSKTYGGTLSKLQVNLAGNLDAFGRLGITLDDLKTMSPYQVLEQVRSALSQMPVGAERTAISAKLLGRGFMSMSKWIAASSTDLDALNKQLKGTGQVMDETELAKAKDDMKQMALLQVDLRGLFVEVGRSAMPIIRDMIPGLKDLLGVVKPLAPHLVQIGEALATFLVVSKVATGLNVMITGLRKVKGIGKGIGNVLGAGGIGTFAKDSSGKTVAQSLLGGGGAADATLKAAISLNTTATEENTLALGGKGIPGGGGGGVLNKVLPVAEGAGGMTLGAAIGTAAGTGIAAGLTLIAPTVIADTLGRNSKVHKEFLAAGADAGKSFATTGMGKGTQAALILTAQNMSRNGEKAGQAYAAGVTRSGSGIARSLRASGDKAGAGLAAGLARGVGPALRSIQRVHNAAGRPIHMGHLDATQMLNEIARVSRAFGGVSSAARTASNAAANAIGAKSGVQSQSYRGYFMAAGGYVPARPGGTLAILGEGGEGETVTPDSKMGRGGTVLNINVANVHGTDRAAATKLANMAGEIFMQQVRFA